MQTFFEIIPVNTVQDIPVYGGDTGNLILVQGGDILEPTGADGIQVLIRDDAPVKTRVMFFQPEAFRRASTFLIRVFSLLPCCPDRHPT